MNRNFYLNIVATLILLILIFFGVVMVGVFDRMRFEQEANRRVIAELTEAVRNIRSVPAGEARGEAASVVNTGAPAANREFFEPDATPGDRIIYVSAADTGNMNYLITNEATLGEFYGICNSSPAARNLANPDVFEPLMAESWKLSEDKLTYTIKLRKGILWHDFTDPVTGKEWRDVEVTAHDFKFYYDVVMNPQTNCAPLRGSLMDIQDIEVINDYEFKVVWKKKYFRSELITLGLGPLPRHLYHAYEGPFDPLKFNDDHQRNRIIVGCGPYRFVRWDKDARVVFTRWEKYFGNELGIGPPVKNIVYEIIKMANTRFQALLGGNIDWMGLTPEQWITRTNVPQFQKGGTLDKYQTGGQSYSYIGYNLRKPLFQDRRVRQALTMLVNRERILKDIYYGLGRIAIGPFYHDSPYYDKGLEPWPFDPQKAKQLLAEAGWRDTDGDGVLDKDGVKFEFTMMEIANSPTQTRMFPIIKEDFAKAGIDMKIQTFEWSVYIQRLDQRNYEACSLAWSMPYDPDQYQVWHSDSDGSGGSNHIGFRNPEADRLIEAIRVEFDVKKRIELAHQFQRLLHEEQPYTFLFAADRLEAISGRYRNVRVFPLGIPAEIIWTPRAQQLTIP
jgi:peptide/nickel transport system substrate-binding protein